MSESGLSSVEREREEKVAVGCMITLGGLLCLWLIFGSEYADPLGFFMKIVIACSLLCLLLYFAYKCDKDAGVSGEMDSLEELLRGETLVDIKVQSCENKLGPEGGDRTELLDCGKQ